MIPRKCQNMPLGPGVQLSTEYELLSNESIIYRGGTSSEKETHARSQLVTYTFLH